MVTMRGKGCRVLAPPSIAIPSVLALLTTRMRIDGDAGMGELVC